MATEDGRTSDAVVELVETCRASGQQDGSLTVALIDAHREEWASEEGNFAVRRDVLMAERLMAVSADGAVVALLGNAHARLDDDFASPMPTGYQPVGALVKQGRTVVSLLGAHSGGTAWCVMDRGERPVAGAHPDGDRTVELGASFPSLSRATGTAASPTSDLSPVPLQRWAAGQAVASVGGRVKWHVENGTSDHPGTLDVGRVVVPGGDPLVESVHGVHPDIVPERPALVLHRRA